MALESDTHRRSSFLKSSQSSPIGFDTDDNDCEPEPKPAPRNKHYKQSQSDDLNHLLYCQQLNPPKRRHTMPAPPGRIVNTGHNNFYSRIRFHRQRNDFFLDLQNRQVHNPKFPDGNKIKNYFQFQKKYRFFMHNDNPKLLGHGAMSVVYKIYSVKDRKQKFAAKIATYTDRESKRTIMTENKRLHRFGNGLFIKDIYDDRESKQLIFVQPSGKDLKLWWGQNKENSIKRQFDKETPMKQEWILKKILYEILLNLKQIHDAGYIHHDIKPQNIIVLKKKQEQCMDTDWSEWINHYSFHIIDYGLTVKCEKGMRVKLNQNDIRFGTFGYNAWELMNINVFRTYNHSIDLYALGITICELAIGQHILRDYNYFTLLFMTTKSICWM
eukprot:429493_1